MRIDVLTSLYPAPERPFEGIFAERRWRAMAARGHEVRVVAPVPWLPRPLHGLAGAARAEAARAPRREERSGVAVERPRFLHVPAMPVGNARRFARAGAAAITPAADVVVCDYAWPAAAIAPRLAAAGRRVVVNGRGSDVLQVRGVAGLRGPLQAGLRAAHGLTAVSQDLLDAMVALAGPQGTRVTALTPNGVDADRFGPGDPAGARQRLGLERTGRVVLVVGHLIERKDPLLALGAFAASDPAPGDRLVLVGRGPLEEAVRARADELDLGAHVTLAGERPPEELVDWYRAADALLLTSSREGRPNVVLEALSCGLPVLATDAGGTSELLRDARMLARTRDPEALGGMLRVLLDDRPSADDLRRSVAHLTWDASLDALTAVLEAVAALPR